jgi:hypothetical protein
MARFQPKLIGDQLVQASTLFASIVECEYVLNIMEMLLTVQNLVKEWAQIELVKKCFKHNYPCLMYKITTNSNLCTCFETPKEGLNL